MLNIGPSQGTIKFLLPTFVIHAVILSAGDGGVKWDPWAIILRWIYIFRDILRTSDRHHQALFSSNLQWPDYRLGLNL